MQLTEHEETKSNEEKNVFQPSLLMFIKNKHCKRILASNRQTLQKRKYEKDHQ